MLQSLARTCSLEACPELTQVTMVDEGFFAVAEHGQTAFLATCGIYVCTGLAIYNPARRRGMLAHITAVSDVTGSLDSLLEGYGEPLSASDVTVVTARQFEPDDRIFHWPTEGEVLDFLGSQNPMSLRIDPRSPDTERFIQTRGMALELATGLVTELDECYPPEHADTSVVQHPIAYSETLQN